MKTFIFSGRAIGILILSLASLLIISCEKESTSGNGDTYALSGNGSGAQEVPTNSSTGTATLTGTYNASTNLLTYDIRWTNLTNVATGVHFHGPAMMGVSAGVLVSLTITTAGINGVASGNVTLTESQETALLNGEVYYNIHTAAFVDGEVRGQVTATKN